MWLNLCYNYIFGEEKWGKFWAVALFYYCGVITFAKVSNAFPFYVSRAI
jgi:hypothetical protein